MGKSWTFIRIRCNLHRYLYYAFYLFSKQAESKVCLAVFSSYSIGCSDVFSSPQWSSSSDCPLWSLEFIELLMNLSNSSCLWNNVCRLKIILCFLLLNFNWGKNCFSCWHLPNIWRSDFGNSTDFTFQGYILLKHLWSVS
jgi:hypothetical protein